MKLIGIFASSLFLLASPPMKGKTDLYELSFAKPQYEVRTGKSSELEVTLGVIVKDGYVHSKSPFSFIVQSPALTFQKTEFKRTDAKVGGQDEKARVLIFQIPYTAVKPGETKVMGKVEFYLCTAKVCNRETAEAMATVIAN